MPAMPESKALPRTLMLSIAVTQGLVLFALYKSVENNTWPSASPLWSFPLWTLASVLPVMMLLSLECDRQKRSLVLAGGFGVVLSALGVYTGWQAMPHAAFPIGSLAGAFAASIAIASFKALMYLQQRASGLPLSYQLLFTYSWRNFLVLSLSALFVLAVWLVLSLWGALFKVIEIDFFARLFRQDWFLFPVLSFSLGLGAIIFRELTRVIDSITGLLRGLIKLLLPLVVMLAVIFLLALPFTGLDVLWATGRGTALLLSLTAIILFFANAVYQDGREASPYPAAIHRLIYFGLLALLPLSALSLYGLTLRLDQYGWTVQRSWAVLVWALLTLFSLGYAGGVIRRRDHWPRALAQVNTAMGLVLLGVLLLANSPLLDFRKISLASQLARVESGAIELGSLDFYYLKQNLARPGYLALEEIKADIGDSDADLLALVENPPSLALAQRLENPEKFWAGVTYRPDGLELPPAVRQVMQQNSFLGSEAPQTVVLEVDLDEDGRAEYALLRVMNGGFTFGHLFYLSDQGWQQVPLEYAGMGLTDEQVLESLSAGDIRTVAPRFKDLQIGELRLGVGQGRGGPFLGLGNPLPVEQRQLLLISPRRRSNYFAGSSLSGSGGAEASRLRIFFLLRR